MKKTILILLLSALTWSVSLESAQGAFGPGVGSWIGLAFIDDCNGEVCAQWDEPGGALHGTLCCISQDNLWSTSFDACESIYYGPPPPRDFI